MYKTIIKFILFTTVLFVLSYSIHAYFNTSPLSFSLFGVYAFHAISSIVIYSLLEFMFSKLPNQVGFAYLMAVFIKIGIFVLIFQEAVFQKAHLLVAERVALVVPLFLFLIVEAIALAKLLSRN